VKRIFGDWSKPKRFIGERIMTMKGSCLCGAVTYEINGSFQFMGNCHCAMCRKAHGSAFATWGIIDSDRFRWVSGEDSVQRYESSAGNQRCFCQVCGSPLVATHAGAVGEVAVGTLDGDPGTRPREHIFVQSKAPWFEISDALPQHEEWPTELDS